MLISVVQGPNSCPGAYIEDVLDVGVRVVWWCKTKIIIECSKEESML
jgi:hypothetical protein